MSLSNDLLSQFVKVNRDTTKPKTETTVYGTTVEYEGKTYVRLDGSDLLTPVESTVATQPDERVTVMIKDHTATITGNLSSPSARKDDVDGLASQISEFEIIVADVVYTDELNAEIARIDQLIAEDVLIRGELKAGTARIDELIAKNAEITGKLTANEAEIADLKTGKLDAEIADIKYATIENLTATNADIHNLSVTFGDFEQLTAKNFEAVNGTFDSLDTKYANIDFANIGEAAIEKIFADSGLIKDLTVSSGTITGELVGVTIKGDLIEANTLKADALVVKGSDGLYYKLNFESGNFTSAEEVPDDGLHGSVIIAKSITADKVSVTDLVAFGATIGGFIITDNAIHSVVKTSVGNTTRGFYVDNNGQFAIGDSNNFVKYYLDTDGQYKLAISADSMILSSKNQSVEDMLDDMQDTVDGLDVVNNIEIGGRNLLKNTKEFLIDAGDSAVPDETYKDFTVRHLKNTGTSTSETVECRNLLKDTKAFGGNFSNDLTSVLDETYNGFAVRYYANSSGGIQNILRYNEFVTIEEYGQQFVFSFWAKGSGSFIFSSDATKGYATCNLSTSTSTNASTALTIKPTADWQRYTITLTATSSNTIPSTINLVLMSSNLSAACKFYTCGWQLENGTVASDWSPSPEDQVAGDSGGDDIVFGMWDNVYTPEQYKENYTLSFWAKGNGTLYACDDCVSTANNAIECATSQDNEFEDAQATISLTGDWTRYWVTWSLGESGSLTEPHSTAFRLPYNSEAYICGCKLEKGNVATDWTPAPEDSTNAIVDAQNTASNAQASASEAQGRVEVAEATLQILADSISSLVTDENGTSLMTQTANGWTFNLSTVTETINSTSETLNDLSGKVDGVDETINNLNALVDDLGKKTAYITMTTDTNGDPCIELGKSDNDFKVRITNTSVDFLEGSSRIAYVNNKSLYIEKAVVKDELQIGESTGFIWKRRSNGNLGLRWIGG